MRNVHRAVIIAVLTEAVSFSETSVTIYQTAWCSMLEDSSLHTCHRENLKSHIVVGSSEDYYLDAEGG
jgi:hypothetical protein